MHVEYQFKIVAVFNSNEALALDPRPLCVLNVLHGWSRKQFVVHYDDFNV